MPTHQITLIVQAENWMDACDVIAESINDVIDGQLKGQRIHPDARCEFEVEEVFCEKAKPPNTP